jgi:hypothetical protein
MRKLALLLLAIALPLFAATYDSVVVRNGDTTFSFGGDPDDTADYGRRFASFEKNGARYLITDAAVLDRIDKELRPQVELGNEQARLGSEQARLGGLQAELGAQQAVIGAKQAAAWNDSDRQRELQAQQHKLQQRQEALAEQQRPLADKQRVLADKQREAGDRAKKRLDTIFDEAIRNGTAKRR